MGVCNCSMFCCTLLYVHSSIAIILMGLRELIDLSSWCLVMVEQLFLAVPRGCLQFVIVVFPDHTHLLFLYTRYLWKKADISGMDDDLQQFSETFTTEFSVDTPINSLWTSFKTKSLSSINKHVPSKMTSSRYSQSWCNRAVQRLSRRKHRAFRKARQNSSTKNWAQYKNIQKSCKEECKKAYNNYVSDMVSDKSSCKKLFSFVKDRNVTAQAWPH